MSKSGLVRSGRDGDQFHYLWAARHCLRLLLATLGLVAYLSIQKMVTPGAKRETVAHLKPEPGRVGTRGHTLTHPAGIKSTFMTFKKRGSSQPDRALAEFEGWVLGIPSIIHTPSKGVRSRDLKQS